MSCRIVTIGDLTVDLVMPVSLPIESGQSQRIPWHTIEPGATGNFLIAGARLGAEMVALGAVGNDLYGHYVRDVLAAEGIDVEGVVIAPGTPTTVVAVLFEPDAGKFSYVWHGGEGDPLPVSDTARRLIEQGDALFMQGFTLSEESLRPLVEHAFSSGKPIWCDVGPSVIHVSDTDRARIRQHVYALMTTEDEVPLIAEGLTGPAAYAFLLESGAQLLVIKRGAQGCMVMTTTERFEVPAFPVKVRDLVGAGDSFNAAFMVGVLRGLSLREAAILANATGGAKVQKLGTGRAMPTRAEVTAVLESGGYRITFQGDSNP